MAMFDVVEKNEDSMTFRIHKTVSLRTAFRKMLKEAGFREIEFLRISFDRDYFYFRVKVKDKIDEDTKKYLRYFLRVL